MRILGWITKSKTTIHLREDCGKNENGKAFTIGEYLSMRCPPLPCQFCMKRADPWQIRILDEVIM
jgi:hypothetical protein